MAFRAGDKTTIIESNTAGAGVDLSTFFIPSGIEALFSGIGVYYPDGNQIQRIDMVPDIVVKPMIQGISEGRDEFLETAIFL